MVLNRLPNAQKNGTELMSSAVQQARQGLILTTSTVLALILLW
jgi:hypothetical protein